jgi:4'-phosphopantetheinyl transferase
MRGVDAPLRSWPPGPPHVRACAGAIDVWRADLTAIGDGLEDLLCADERARAARIVPARKRVLWAHSRGVLRALLGRYLERDPRALRFVLGPHGKPALARDGTDAGGDLRFNLSHSGRLALIAVSAAREVGVDLEIAGRRVLDEPAIAARVLGRAQAERLAELDPQTREREFMRAWVAHEAAVKCLGVGLGLGIEVATPGDSTSGLATQGDLWTAELDVGPDGYAAAVAVAGGECELHRWDWRG